MELEGSSLLLKEISKYLKNGDKLCEIGSGSCNLLKDLIKKYNVKGCGVDPYGISLKKNNPACYQIVAEKLSTLNFNFNIIYSIRSFHHIKLPGLSLNEAYKCIKNKGYLITVDWKWGANTGVAEKYYSLSKMIELYESSGFIVISKIDGQYNFCITGQKP